MKLTDKQERFVQGLFRGLSQREAYKQSYDAKNMKDETIDVRACKLVKEYKISQRLQELRDEQTRESKWSVDRLIKEFEEVKRKCMQEEEVMKFIDGEWVGTGEYVFKDTGAIKSLENIGKLIGAYEREEKEEKPIEVVIKRRKRRSESEGKE